MEEYGVHNFIRNTDGTFNCSICTLPGPPGVGDTPLRCQANPSQGKFLLHIFSIYIVS